MTTPLAAIEENCRGFAVTIKNTLPPDVGVVVILFNRRTGRVFMRAPDASRKQTDEIFKALVARPGESNLIIPAGRFSQ